MPVDGFILGIDLGTTALKGAIFDVRGKLLGNASAAYPTTRVSNGHVEQDPADWLHAFWTVVETLLADRDPAALVAVGICSQVNTYVFVDEAGVALAPAITWQDIRAADQARRIDGQISDEQRFRWWPSGMGVSASHTLACMAWMSAERPTVWAATAKVLSPKDYLLRHLTGRWTADPLSAFDLVDQSSQYIEELIALVPGAGERLAPLGNYRSIVGPLDHPRLSGCSAIVVHGTMDAFGCLFGSGAARPGEGSYISGTSEIVALIGDRAGGSPGIVSFVPIDDWHVQAGPTQSGGDTLRWLATLFSTTHEAVLAMAATADRDDDGEGLLFLPHLEGERAPLWDSQARGSFLGMTSSDGAAQLAIAALEGVALSARLIFEGASRAIGTKPQALFVGGTGNRSDLWVQIRADALGVPLHRVECLDTGTVGAAIMAGLGAGLFDSIEAASSAFVRVERSFMPDLSKTNRYNRLMERYLLAYESLKPLYLQHKIAELV